MSVQGVHASTITYTPSNLTLDSTTTIQGLSDLRTASGNLYLNWNRPVVDSDYIGYWNFDDANGTSTAVDSSTHANKATLQNITSYSPGLTTATPYAGANDIGFDSANYVSAGNVLLYEKTQPWTAMGAIKVYTKPPAGGAEIIFSNVNASPFPGYELWINDAGQLHVRIVNNIFTNYIGVKGTTDVTDNNWHFVAASYDGSGTAAGVKIYLDGVAQTTTVESDNLTGSSVSTGPLLIGNQTLYENQFFLRGYLDEFSLSNIVRSPSYISTYSTSSSLPPDDANTVLSYHFNQTSGTTATDSSSNAYNGTLTMPDMFTHYPSELWLGNRTLQVMGHSTDYASAPSIPLYNLGSTFTITMWSNSLVNPSTGLLQRYPSWDFMSGYSGTGNFLSWYDGTAFKQSAYTPGIGWHQYAVRFNSGTLDYLVDGSIIKTQSGVATPAVSTAILTFGQSVGAGASLTGYISNTTISSTTRSDAYLQQFAKRYPPWGIANINPSVSTGSGGGDFGSTMNITELDANFSQPYLTSIQYRIGSGSSAAAATADKQGQSFATLNPTNSINKTGRYIDYDVKLISSSDTLASSTPSLSSITLTYANAITPPTLLTPNFSGVTQTGATASSSISATGGENPATEGFAWGTDTSYSIGTTSASGSFGISDFQNATTTLTCGTIYHVRAYATNSGGTGFSSDASTTTSPCNATAYTFAGPPSGNVGSASTNFTVTPNGPYTGNIILTPTGSGSTGLSATTLSFSNSSIAQTFTITPTVAGSITLTPTNSGSLTNPSNLTYSVNAVVPGSPTSVSAATSSPNQATISFSAPAFDGGSSILYYLASSTPGNLTGTSSGSPITVTDLTNGTSYTFAVYAVNAAGTSSPSTASNAVIPIGVPGAPTGVVATAGNTQAVVNFSAPVSTGGSQITGYTVTSSPASGTDTDAGSTTLTHTVTNLANGTPYTFTVTATNIVGTGSASGASSPITPSTVVAVSTNVITNIASTSATLSGSITSTGGSDASQHGFAYGTVADLSTVIATTTLGSQIGTGTFTSSVTGITPNTTYYVRAYAVNVSGTTTGSIISFLTLPTVPTLTTQAPTAGSGVFFSANGNITATGGVNATVRGFVYGTTIAYGATTTESGSFTTGAYNATITGLDCNTLYHVASYAVNTGGTSYGSDQTITTGACTKPTVATSTPSGITTTVATLNGAITDEGNASSTIEGFNWGNDTNYGQIASTNGIFGIGTFSQSLTGLTCGTTYHYQAFATNFAGQGTSNDQSFTTSACSSSGGGSVSSGGGGGGGSVSLTALAALLAPSASTTAYLNSLTAPGCPTGLVCTPNQVPTPQTVSNLPSINLTLGSQGNDVTELQNFLIANNYLGPRYNTGYFGPLTMAALAKYQTDHDISPAIGYYGPITRATIDATVPTTSAPTTPSATAPEVFARDLYFGITGSDVRDLQKFLNANSFIIATSGPGSPGNESDYFGPATRDALIRFQNYNHITPAQGYFGPVTRNIVDAMMK